MGHQITAFLCLTDLGLLHRPLEKGVDMGSLRKSASRWDPQGLIIRPYTVSCDLCGASGSCPVDFPGPCRLRSLPTCVEGRRTSEKTGANLTKTVTKTKWLGEKKRQKKKKEEQNRQQSQPMLSLSRNSIYLVSAWRCSTVFDRCAMHPVIRAERNVSI